MRALYWIIGTLVIVLVVVAVGRSPLYRGFIGGEFLADLTVADVETAQNGVLLNMTAKIAHEGEPIRVDYFIVSAEARLAGIGDGISEPVWKENIAVRTLGKSAEKMYEAKFTAPLPLGEYEVTFAADLTNLVAERNEKNNTFVKKVTVDL